MNKKICGGVIVMLLVLFGGYWYASPYLAMNGIQNAVQKADSEKLSTYIDYPSVRQSFKDQTSKYLMKDLSKEENGWETLGTVLATTILDKMADAVITPEGMTLLLQGKNVFQSVEDGEIPEEQSEQTKKKMQYSARYLTMNAFEITLLNTENDKKYKVIMEREGLGWKIKRIGLPQNDTRPANTTFKSAGLTQDTEPQPYIPPVPEHDAVLSESAEVEQAATTIFDHSKAQIGATMESCYHDPCSVAKVMNFQILNQSPDDVDVELTVVGGSRGWEAKKVSWNHEKHTIQVTCSLEKPTLRIQGQVTVIPLSAQGVPGVLTSDAETYLQTCHGDFSGTIEDAATYYGYNVQ